MSIFVNGIVFGCLLSFLVGPAFFILLETSIKKGFKSALFLDIGILLSDAIYLLASIFVAEKINIWLASYTFIKYVAGSIFILLGVISIFKNYNGLKNEITKKSNLKELSDISENSINPFQLIVKGIGLNSINPGVLVFWIATCTYATNELNIQGIQLLYYFGTTLVTMFSVDILKIYFSSKLKEKLNDKAISIIGIVIGFILAFFGVAVYFKDIQI
jgi:threonine/homoserine/homoserine lactone efflux protein